MDPELQQFFCLHLEFFHCKAQVSFGNFLDQSYILFFISAYKFWYFFIVDVTKSEKGELPKLSRDPQAIQAATCRDTFVFNPGKTDLTTYNRICATCGAPMKGVSLANGSWNRPGHTQSSTC